MVHLCISQILQIELVCNAFFAALQFQHSFSCATKRHKGACCLGSPADAICKWTVFLSAFQILELVRHWNSASSYQTMRDSLNVVELSWISQTCLPNCLSLGPREFLFLSNSSYKELIFGEQRRKPTKANSKIWKINHQKIEVSRISYSPRSTDLGVVDAGNQRPVVCTNKTGC